MEIYSLNLWTHMDETRTKWNHILPLYDAAASWRVNRPWGGGGVTCVLTIISQKIPPPPTPQDQGLGLVTFSLIGWNRQRHRKAPSSNSPCPRPCRMLVKCAKSDIYRRRNVSSSQVLNHRMNLFISQSPLVLESITPDPACNEFGFNLKPVYVCACIGN